MKSGEEEDGKGNKEEGRKVRGKGEERERKAGGKGRREKG